MELQDLCGRHWLDAVELITGVGEEPNGIRFRIDHRVYTAYEDPDDGYRSSMREIVRERKTAMTNVFEPVHINAAMCSDADTDILEFTDVETNKIVLRVGTNTSDNYYPWFVSEWQPENMVVNQHVAAPVIEESPIPDVVSETPKRKLSPEALRQLRIIR